MDKFKALQPNLDRLKHSMAHRRANSDDKLPVVSANGVICATPIQIDLPEFSGSLPMLFASVREHKIALLDVPLMPICEAYFAYLIENAEANLDEAAAALAALSWLLERKAWMLLPVDEPEPEEAEFQNELPEPTTYAFADAIEALKVWEDERSMLFFRPTDSGPDPYELPFTLGDVTSGDLARALERLLNRAKPEVPQSLSKARRSITEQMGLVLRALRPEWTALENLMEEPFTKTDVVYWFLALLELIRLGQAQVRLYDGDVQFARSR